MTCPACGSPTVPGARFCFACGLPLTGPTIDAATERRVVTVVFGDLSDFTSWAEDLDPERVGVVTDRVLAQLAQVVVDFGGHVDKFTGDGLMAVFGAPTAHEDDPERAVRAASRMQAVVRRLVEQESGGGTRLGLRVGLNTGEVVAGIQAHLSYTVIGDAVNTAARLSDAAGVGAVYAGRDTALATMTVASWRALPLLRLKGKRQPVPAYELVGLRPAQASRLGLGDEAPLIGREAEFGMLVGRLLEAVDGAGARSVLLAGDAGVGKTRLAQELSRFAGELPGARVLWGRCAPYGEGRDLAAVADMVRTACGVVPQDDAETARERVERTVARYVPAVGSGPVAERLSALIGVSEPSAPAPASAPGAPEGGARMRQAVAALFSALAASAPLVLVVDDVHWASSTMLAGLLDVGRQLRGQVLLLVLGRPDVLDDSSGPAWWRGLPEPEVLVVAPLDPSATERLLRACLDVPAGGLDDRVRDALLPRAQGNPFFLAELLHLLVDRGILRRDGERWLLEEEQGDGHPWPAELPAGVHAVLAARIDGLDGAAKGVLRDASVLGLTLRLDGLEAVGRASGHGDPDVVGRAVAALVDRRLLEPVPDTDRLRFTHPMVRDVAYAGLAKAERARRHAAAAEHALGPSAGVPVGSPAPRVSEADLVAAAHGERAVRLAREMRLSPADPAWRARGVAYAALARLGQEALGRDDAAGAQAPLARALALTAPAFGEPLPPDLVVPVRLARAQALTRLHRLAEAEVELAPALAGDCAALRAGALTVLGEVRRRRGDTAGAHEALVSALAVAGSAGVDRLSGHALRELGRLDQADGRLRAAEQRFRQAHVLAEQVADGRGAGWALQHLAWSATTRGDYALADEALRDAAAVFAGLDDSAGRSWVTGTQALVLLLQGRLAGARELVAALLPVAQAGGERWATAALLVVDALAAAELGDLPLATDRAAQARGVFAAEGDVWGESLALLAVGVAARAAGEPERALVAFEAAVRLAARHPLVAGLALVAAGNAQLDRGDDDAAQASAQRAAAVLGGLELEPHACAGVQLLRAEVLRRRGRPAAALAELDAALAAAGEATLLFPRGQALAQRAVTLLDLGHHEQALAAARRAVATPVEDVRSTVVALRALGVALRAAGEFGQASQVLSQALRLARSAGLRAEVAATDRELAARD